MCKSLLLGGFQLSLQPVCRSFPACEVERHPSPSCGIPLALGLKYRQHLSCRYTGCDATRRLANFKNGRLSHLLKIGKPLINNFVQVKLSNRSRRLQPVSSCQWRHILVATRCLRSVQTHLYTERW